MRQGDRGPELLFVRRPESMRFLGGFHAFPGGAVDPVDSSEEAAETSTLSFEEASRRMGSAADGGPALGFFMCALREVFEEIGILYVEDDSAVSRIGADGLEKLRRQLLDNEISFPALLRQLGVKAATHKLRYHSRRTAPEVVPVRFDARVFVITAEGVPIAEPTEVASLDWLTPGQALAMAESGVLKMAPPTLGILSTLAHFDSAEELMTGEIKEGPPATVDRLSDLVHRVLAPNPGIMSGPGTNSYIVGRDDVVVIDPGTLDPSHLKALANAAPRMSAIVITHRHPDHFTGAVELAGVTGAEIAVSSSFAPYDLPETARRLSDGDKISVQGVTLTVIETPGHASDHIALWFEEEKALFSGDLILGEGTSVISPPDGNLTQYMKSLDRVAELPVERIYPGHHPLRDDAKEWIEYYISHRKERDEQILSSLAEGAKTIPAIVAEVYASYPKALHPVAERSVRAHLEKLQGEGRVVTERDTWKRS